jgi:hypothetical protein
MLPSPPMAGQKESARSCRPSLVTDARRLQHQRDRARDVRGRHRRATERAVLTSGHGRHDVQAGRGDIGDDVGGRPIGRRVRPVALIDDAATGEVGHVVADVRRTHADGLEDVAGTGRPARSAVVADGERRERTGQVDVAGRLDHFVAVAHGAQRHTDDVRRLARRFAVGVERGDRPLHTGDHLRQRAEPAGDDDSGHQVRAGRDADLRARGVPAGDGPRHVGPVVSGVVRRGVHRGAVLGELGPAAGVFGVRRVVARQLAREIGVVGVDAGVEDRHPYTGAGELSCCTRSAPIFCTPQAAAASVAWRAGTFWTLGSAGVFIVKLGMTWSTSGRAATASRVAGVARARTMFFSQNVLTTWSPRDPTRFTSGACMAFAESVRVTTSQRK